MTFLTFLFSEIRTLIETQSWRQIFTHFQSLPLTFIALICALSGVFSAILMSVLNEIILKPLIPVKWDTSHDSALLCEPRLTLVFDVFKLLNFLVFVRYFLLKFVDWGLVGSFLRFLGLLWLFWLFCHNTWLVWQKFIPLISGVRKWRENIWGLRDMFCCFWFIIKVQICLYRNRLPNNIIFLQFNRGLLRLIQNLISILV